MTDVFRAARHRPYRSNSASALPIWARDWMQMNRNLFSALKLEKTMMFLLLVLITIVASFNIVSTLTMIVTEKQREIAILKAMGATRKGIMRIFMFNGLIIGCSGAAIGVPLGYTFLWLIQTFWTFDPTVYYISRIPVHVQAIGRHARGRIRHRDQLRRHPLSLAAGSQTRPGGCTSIRMSATTSNGEIDELWRL